MTLLHLLATRVSINALLSLLKETPELEVVNFHPPHLLHGLGDAFPAG